MPYFNSTAIKRAEYDAATQTLTIWFASGSGSYDYYRVPQRVFDGLCRASSKGDYFHTHIKDHYSAR